MRFLLLLPLLGCVRAAMVVPTGPGSYVLVDDDGRTYDCRAEARAPDAWDPVCVEVDFRDEPPAAAE